MLAVFGAFEGREFRLAADDFDAVDDEFFQDRLERQCLRHAVDQCDRVDMESIPSSWVCLYK